MPTVTTVRTDLRRGINSGAAFKIPCKVATTAAITLEGLQTIDGVSVAADDSVLVKNQADSTFNGIYWAATGQWTRRPDFDGYFDTRHGTLVWVNQGTTNALTLWRVSTSDLSAAQGPLPGTTGITFTQVSLGGSGAAAVKGFNAARTTNQTSGGTCIFDSVSAVGCFDSDSLINTSTGVFTADADGIWVPCATLYVENTAGEGSPAFPQIEMRLGSDAVALSEWDALQDAGTFVLSPGPLLLTNGQTLSVVRSDNNWSSTVRLRGASWGTSGKVSRFGVYYAGAL